MPQSVSQPLTLNVIAVTALTIGTTTLPNAIEFSPYSQQLVAIGGTAPYTWSISAGSLPAGLTMSSAGLISGVSSVSGSFSFTAQVVDSGA